MIFAAAVWLLTVTVITVVVAAVHRAERGEAERRIERWTRLQRAGTVITPLRRRQIDTVVELDEVRP